MAKFSERYGYTAPREVLQVDSVDEDLRVGLWNALDAVYWSAAKPARVGIYMRFIVTPRYNPEHFELVQNLWFSYFKRPTEEISDKYESEWPTVLNVVRDYFMNAAWYEIYDFIEFVTQSYPDKRTNERFKQLANAMLEREGAAWRFVGDEITQITSEVEILAIENALALEAFPLASRHIDRALEMISDRQEPDYRNSVKESISAVEAAVRAATGNESATLSDGVRVLDERHGLHPAMKEALKKLYAYAGDGGGIRHALKDEQHVTPAESRFVLSLSAAFVSFLADPGSEERT